MFVKLRGCLSNEFVSRVLHDRHDLHSKTASGEMPRTECRSIHDVCRPHQSFSRDGLGKTMTKFGCAPRFISLVRQFHDGMQASVQNDGEFSEPFEVTNGIKQGCVMAPTLLRCFLSCSWMLFRTVTLVFQSGTVLMAIYSTLESCKPKLRCKPMC